MKIKQVIGITISLLGCLISLLAMGASQIGLDQDQGWGPARWFLLGTGLVLILIPHIRMLTRQSFGRIMDLSTRYFPGIESAFESIKGGIARLNELPMVGEKTVSPKGQRGFWINVQLSAIFLISVAAFTFLISVGRWTTWLVTTEHFHLLAAGFRSGQTYLAIDPNPALLELEDPYPFENRQDVDQLWDASLYNGKYYLYWGPMPALVTLAIESFGNIQVDDPHLTWLFLVGMLLINLLILRNLWSYEFDTLPAWSILPPALVMGLSNPLPWLMSRPAVYEAAIAAGQFFFLLGIYWVLVLARKPLGGTWFIAIPGICLAMAIASRLTLAPAAILLLSGFILLRKSSEQKINGSARHSFWILTAIAFTPIILGLAGLAIYNFVRFGSFFELGHRYQLTLQGLAGNYASSFSTRNILPNLYNYFLNPFRRIETFPFVKALWGSYSVPILRANASQSYHVEQVTGTLISVPFILYGVVPLLGWGRSIWKQIGDSRLGEIQISTIIPGDWGWLYLVLVVTAGLTLIPILIISYSTMRYLLDMLPMLLILASIGFAYCLQEFGQKRLNRIGFFLSGICLSGYSAIIGVLLGVTGYFANFEYFNPELFDRISRFLAF